jgi:hypothetical protein
MSAFAVGYFVGSLATLSINRGPRSPNAHDGGVTSQSTSAFRRASMIEFLGFISRFDAVLPQRC